MKIQIKSTTVAHTREHEKEKAKPSHKEPIQRENEKPTNHNSTVVFVVENRSEKPRESLVYLEYVGSEISLPKRAVP